MVRTQTINVFEFDPEKPPEDGTSLYYYGGEESNILIEAIYAKDLPFELEKGDKYVLHEDMATLLSAG